MVSKPKQTLVQSAANGRSEPCVTDAAGWANGGNGRKVDAGHTADGLWGNLVPAFTLIESVESRALADTGVSEIIAGDVREPNLVLLEHIGGGLEMGPLSSCSICTSTVSEQHF